MTRRFTFTFEEDGETVAGHYFPGREIKHVHYDIDKWSDLLPRFKEFLLGIGYIIDGELVVEDDHIGRESKDEYKEDQDPDLAGC